MNGRKISTGRRHMGVAAVLLLSLFSLQGCDGPVGLGSDDRRLESGPLLDEVATPAITRMSGAGTLGDGSPLGENIWLQSFDFIVGIENGVLDGVLDYTDYSVLKEDGNPANLKVDDAHQGTAILSFTQISATCVNFSGVGEVTNTGELVSFTAEACDNGDPGVSMDVFGIRVPDRMITHNTEYVRRDVTSDGEITATMLSAATAEITRMRGTGALIAGEDTVDQQLFDVDVGVESGVVGGSLDYTDQRLTLADGNHARFRAGPDEEGTAITSFLQTSNTCIEATGVGKIINTGELLRFRIQACDSAPEDSHLDVFGIWVPEHEYQRGPDLLWSGDLIAERMIQ